MSEDACSPAPDAREIAAVEASAWTIGEQRSNMTRAGLRSCHVRAGEVPSNGKAHGYQYGSHTPQGVLYMAGGGCE